MIKIGALSCETGIWQANTVAKQLEHFGQETEIKIIESNVDEDFKEGYIYERSLDKALLNNEIDIAVYSLVDVPTKLPQGIVQAAVLKRGDYNDVLIFKEDEELFTKKNAIIAARSLRERSQWLYRYPNHIIKEFNGSVKTRLDKLQNSDWDGAIFSKSDLKRIDLLPEDHMKLEWMVPAPAQGTVMIATLENSNELIDICKELNDEETEKSVSLERRFLNELNVGLNAPVGALVTIKDDKLKFKGVIFSPDGDNRIEFTKEVDTFHTTDLAEYAARFILDRNGKKIMRQEIDIDKKILLYSTKVLSLNQVGTLPSKIGVHASDFITVRFNRLKPVIVKNTIDNVVFTNQLAVESILNNFSPAELDFKSIFCVGKRTKRFIEKNIGKVNQEEKSEENLITYLNNNLKDQEVTYFCDNNKNDEFSNTLEKNNISVNKIECYKTVLTPDKLEKNYKGILFYSPEGIESYLIENKVKNEIAFCNSEVTATLAKKHFEKVIVAKLSTVESIIRSVKEYYKEK
ncbi:MAG: hydroxymethylbilane synthase [Bacteroidota bacterium]